MYLCIYYKEGVSILYSHGIVYYVYGNTIMRSKHQLHTHTYFLHISLSLCIICTMQHTFSKKVSKLCICIIDKTLINPTFSAVWAHIPILPLFSQNAGIYTIFHYIITKLFIVVWLLDWSSPLHILLQYKGIFWYFMTTLLFWLGIFK